MLTPSDFVRLSLETNLFWARIMKEHLIFLHAGFTCKDLAFIQQSDYLRSIANSVLAETISLSNGNIPIEALMSNEFVTNNTLPAEQKTMSLSGIPINTGLTSAEMALVGSPAFAVSPQLTNAVYSLNQRAVVLANGIAAFKQSIINAVSSCQLFTWLFPSMLDHLLRESLLYSSMLAELQNGISPVEPVNPGHFESIWDTIMSEHAAFIEHMLDPTEKTLIQNAQSFHKFFEVLSDEAEAADNNLSEVAAVTGRTVPAVTSFRNFKQQGTDLILACKVKSLINPLLADHVTREANHYLRLLGKLQ